MTNYDFTEVEAPQGTFIGWTDKPGQVVTIRVTSYSPNGGTDFNKQPCPQVTGTLLEDCPNFKDKGATMERLDAGAAVIITAGQTDIKKKLEKIDPAPADGDVIRFTTEGMTPTAAGSMRVTKVEHARGTFASEALAPAAAPAAAPDTSFLDGF